MNVNFKKKVKAISLIELLVTLSIMVLIISVLYSVFSISLRGWKKSNNLLDVSTTARVVLERMSREISSAIIKPGNEFYCAGYDQTAPSGFRTDNQADEFYFIAAVNPNYATGSDLCELGYWLGLSEEEELVLKRFYVADDRKDDPADPEFDFNYATGSSFEFAVNVQGLNFQFYDQAGANYNSWDSRTSGNAPSKIKITITVSYGKGAKATNPDFISKDFSTIISFPQ
ncbi:MAG: prepilin-type N-terminal cleavage/methylation domain-containing protein [Candidatus Omnitrophota bacterium]